MNDQRPIYVIDTNVLVDYPGIIPDKTGRVRVLNNPSVDLAGTHRVIPSPVIRELSSFKGEHSDRGKAAREVLKNIRSLFTGRVCSMKEAYALGMTVTLPDDGRLSVLPVHADFKVGLPFRPAEDDMDGQIILAALAAICVRTFRQKNPGWTKVTEIDWSDAAKYLESGAQNVLLITNDNGLAIRAGERGVEALRYSCDLPKPYTGRREVVVPAEVFSEFYTERKLDRDVWETYLPNEEPLVANEFVVMRLAEAGDYPEGYDPSDDRFYRYIGRYDMTMDKIVRLRYVSEAPFQIRSDGQAMYAEALLDPKIAAVVCTGPAGSGKTYLPTVCGLSACQAGRYTDIVIVPCADIGKMGALPGDLNEKMSLDVGPFRNALRNYLLQEDSKWRREFEQLQKNGVSPNAAQDGEEEPPSFNDRLQSKIESLWRLFFRNIPVEKARGLDFLKELALYDEFQDQNPSQADMLIKRIGGDGKIVITGDTKQIHAPYLDENNNGIVYATTLLYNSPLVARVSLLKDEVERHELVRMIAERQAKGLK